MKSIGLLNHNIPTLKRLVRINAKELLFQIGAELRHGLYKTLSFDGNILPNTIYYEPGSYCPDRCKGCYVPVKDRMQNIQLPDDAISQITDFASEVKTPYLAVLGGDPFHDVVFDRTYATLFQNPHLRFVVCNDGESLLQGDKIEKVQNLSNTSPVFSIDGFAPTNDKIRGNGKFQKSIESLETYSNGGKHLTGAFSIIRPENIEEVTGADFINSIVDKGCHYLTYSSIYTERGSDYPIAPETYADRLIGLMKISDKLPAAIFTTQFGQITPHKLSLKERLHAITIDYNGELYSSRRGVSLGNIKNPDTSLKNIIYGNEFKSIFNKKHRDLEFSEIAYTDRRYDSFIGEVIDILQAKGVHVDRPAA